MAEDPPAPRRMFSNDVPPPPPEGSGLRVYASGLLGVCALVLPLVVFEIAHPTSVNDRPLMVWAAGLVPGALAVALATKDLRRPVGSRATAVVCVVLASFAIVCTLLVGALSAFGV